MPGITSLDPMVASAEKALGSMPIDQALQFMLSKGVNPNLAAMVIKARMLKKAAAQQPQGQPPQSNVDQDQDSQLQAALSQRSQGVAGMHVPSSTFSQFKQPGLAGGGIVAFDGGGPAVGDVGPTVNAQMLAWAQMQERIKALQNAQQPQAPNQPVVPGPNPPAASMFGQPPAGGGIADRLRANANPMSVIADKLGGYPGQRDVPMGGAPVGGPPPGIAPSGVQAPIPGSQPIGGPGAPPPLGGGAFAPSPQPGAALAKPSVQTGPQTGASGASTATTRGPDVGGFGHAEQLAKQQQQESIANIAELKPQSYDQILANLSRTADEQGMGAAAQEHLKDLEARKAQIGQLAQQGKWSAIAQMGFSMAEAATKNPHGGFLGALAVGGAKGGEMYTQTLKDVREFTNNLNDQKYATMQAQEALKLHYSDKALDAYDKQVGRYENALSRVDAANSRLVSVVAGKELQGMITKAAYYNRMAYDPRVLTYQDLTHSGMEPLEALKAVNQADPRALAAADNNTARLITARATLSEKNSTYQRLESRAFDSSGRVPLEDKAAALKAMRDMENHWANLGGAPEQSSGINESDWTGFTKVKP